MKATAHVDSLEDLGDRITVKAIVAALQPFTVTK